MPPHEQQFSVKRNINRKKLHIQLMVLGGVFVGRGCCFFLALYNNYLLKIKDQPPPIHPNILEHYHRVLD